MNKNEFRELLNTELADFFGKMSGYFDKRFAEQDAKLARMQDTLDGLVKQQETDDHERVALSNQVDRHEGWIKQLAAKVGVRLSHD
jgi:hypothetical protein